MSIPTTENNFCRRCGTKLDHHHGNLFVCSNNHKIYETSPPAVAVIILNERNEIAVITRAIDPGKGRIDFPGGFCDYGEAPIDALYRELEEEIGLKESDISDVKLLHSGVDPYIFDGEEISVISIVYEAKCSNAELQAMDDVATSEFVSIDKLSKKDIFFPCLQEAFDIIRTRENYA